VKFNPSARGFVLFHTSPVYWSSFSVEKHLFIFKKISIGPVFVSKLAKNRQ